MNLYQVNDGKRKSVPHERHSKLFADKIMNKTAYLMKRYLATEKVIQNQQHD